jgi:hypothetical protein
VMAYALFPRDTHYHPVRPGADRTFCGRVTKESDEGAAGRPPPALVTAQRPMLSSHAACPDCQAASGMDGDGTRRDVLRRP